MKKFKRIFSVRLTAMLLALACIAGVLPISALAADGDTIKLERFGYSGVTYNSASLGRCLIHQMYYEHNGATTIGFCGTKGASMNQSFAGQTWGNPQPVTDPTVQMMMAYYYAHSTGTFTDEAHALGVDEVWTAGYTWYMNAWVQAIIWRFKEGTLNSPDPVTACAEELMWVWNSLEGTNYTSIDEERDGSTFRDRTQYIIDLGNQGVWGECTVKEYTYAGSSAPVSSVQKILVGELSVPHDEYELTVKKVDSTNPSKGLSGAEFLIQSENSSFTKTVITGRDGTYTLKGLSAGVYGVTELQSPENYEIDNPGPQYVTLPNNGENTVTVTFTDTRTITGEGSIRKVDADDPTKGLAGAVVKIEGVDNNFTGTYTSGEGGYFTDIPWDSMPIGSYTATEITPPSNYSLSSDPSKARQSFFWDGQTDVSLIFENDAKVKIELLKLDNSGNPLPGAVFNIIKDGQVVGTEATKADGTITITDVTEGMYAFVEVSAPAPYATLREPVFAHVDQATINGGGTVTVTASDKRLPNLTILKRDAQTGDVIPDIHFEILGLHYGYHNDVTTGPDGTATLVGIPVDSYTVTEKSVPDPYVVGDEPTQTIWLEPGDEKQLVFDNYKQPELTLSKIDADTNQPIPGTVLTVKSLDGDYQDDWTTGADGKVSKRVPAGTYEITEKSVPAPYYLPDRDADRVQTITLKPGEEQTVVFRNYKMPELTIFKVDSLSGEPVEGAKFHVVFTSNGESAEAPASADYGCQRRLEIVRKRRRNFVIFRRRGDNKIKRFLAEKEC